MITNYLDYVSLCSKMAEYQRIYHSTGEEPIPNDEYDRLRKELIAWEEANPDQTLEFSPSFKVGYIEPSRKNEELRHEYPMLSLENGLNEEENKSWANLWVTKYGPDVQVIGEFKYDGLALSLRYVDGAFIRALTRGDGEYGEDVTIHVAKFVPAHIEVQGIVEIRGEAIVNTKNFELINSIRGEKYANARSAVCGILNPAQREVNKHAAFVSFIPYDLEGPDFVFNFYTDKLEALKQLDFQMLSCFVLTPEKIQSVFDQISEIRLRGDIPFDIDGMVFKIDDMKKQMELGQSNHSPRYAFAAKFPPITAPCTLREVVFQVGRSGEIAPVAKITATPLMGVIVTSVLLHNEDRMKDRKIAVGNTYEVFRSGDVIPHLGKLLKEVAEPVLVTFPTTCPSCGGRVEKKGATYYCVNEVSCPAQNIASLAYAVSRDVLNVDGLAEQTIELLMQAGLVRCVADIFKLSPHALAQLKGYTPYSADKLWTAINAARRVTFDRFIMALGIPEVGKSTSRKLAQRIFKRKALFELDSPEKVLELKVPTVGKETAANIAAFFSNPILRTEAEELMKVLIIPEMAETEITPITGVTGKTFVFTGKFSEVRDIMENKVLAAGGHVTGSVSAQTDYVVVGERPGSSLRKANLLGVDTIDERVFLSFFRVADGTSLPINFDGAFTKSLGPAMAKQLTEARFVAEPNDPIIAHRFKQSVLITHLDSDAKNREKVLQHYLKFYEEIVEKLQLQAHELYPDIFIEPDLSHAVTDMLRKFLERAMSGDPKYAPYLMKVAPQSPEDLTHGVEVALFVGITNPTERYVRSLYWFINTEYWIRDPADLTTMRKVLDIEDSDIYSPPLPPLPPLPEE